MRTFQSHASPELGLAGPQEQPRSTPRRGLIAGKRRMVFDIAKGGRGNVARSVWHPAAGQVQGVVSSAAQCMMPTEVERGGARSARVYLFESSESFHQATGTIHSNMSLHAGHGPAKTLTKPIAVPWSKGT